MNVHKIAYTRVIALAFAAFIFNTTEFIPVALLSDIAADFSMDVTSTGLIITIYAWAVSILSLPLMLLTSKLERKRLLLRLFALFTLSHVLAAIAWNFAVLVIARLGIAISHAIFWSITSSLVVRLAPINKGSQAIGMLALGTSLAMVLGLPLGRVVGELLGWRITFFAIGALAAAEALFLWKILPFLPSRRAGSLASLPMLARRPMLLALYLLTFLIVGAHFTTYSYVEPFVAKFNPAGDHFVTYVLLAFGASGILASMLFSKLYRSFSNAFLICSILFILASVLTLKAFVANDAALLLAAFVWGIGISGFGLCLQIRVLALAPDATDIAISIYSAIYNVGIGGGALLGHQVATRFGLWHIGEAGAILGALGLASYLYASVKFAQKNSA